MTSTKYSIYLYVMTQDINLGKLLNIEEYVDYGFGDTICLDGDFTIEELERIVKWFKENKEKI